MFHVCSWELDPSSHIIHVDVYQIKSFNTYFNVKLTHLITTPLLKPLTTTSFLTRRPYSTDNSTTISVEKSVPFTGHNCDPPSRSITTTPSELMGSGMDAAATANVAVSSPVTRQKATAGFGMACRVVWGYEDLREMRETSVCTVCLFKG
ncbi:hypothetical protein CTI12_AA342290 [Artemisia annua]|uniref:Uncharacterized protein n=1 Tax=Artemisia annua TaxID=35608 RepID=A0A2U1MTT5_ARTAN|nr:hypothetical protein CTI12_AA342290 [Artemisia annua]